MKTAIAIAGTRTGATSRVAAAAVTADSVLTLCVNAVLSSAVVTSTTASVINTHH